MKAKFLLPLLGITLLISGCGGIGAKQHLDSTRNRLLAEGQPDSYVDGYVDGCSSGMRLACDNRFQYQKNIVRYDRDALYAKGWQDGQICCRNEALIEQQQQALSSTYGNMNAYEREEAERRKCAQEAEMRMMWEEMKK